MFNYKPTVLRYQYRSRTSTVRYMYIRNFVFIVFTAVFHREFLHWLRAEKKQTKWFSSGKYDPLCPIKFFKRSPQSAGTLFGRCKKETRRVMIYRNIEARARDKKRETKKKERKRKRGGERSANMYYIRTRGNIYMYDVLQQVTHSWCRECTRWAMVHMGNECSVVDGTCCEHTGSFIHRKQGATVE